MRVLWFRPIGLSATVLAAALGVGVALAQAPTPTYPECTKKATKDDTEAAKNAHRVATQFYDRADYDKAIQYWTDAYKFDCSATDLLINIANAYEKKGDRASTVVTLETYLKRSPPNPTIEEKVRNLKALMAQPTATASAPPPVPTVVPTAPPTTMPTTAPAAPPSDGPRPYGAKPWFLVGGGGALALVGAILLPVGLGNVSTAEAGCPNRNCPSNAAGQSLASQGNTGRSEAGAGWGLLGVGVAAAAGGLIWQFVYNKPGPAQGSSTTGVRNMWLAPVVSGNPAGVPQTPPVGSRAASGLTAGGTF